MANYSNEDGVWRTIGGRRVFIKNGQSLEEAMKESGKFKKKDDNNNPPRQKAKGLKKEANPYDDPESEESQRLQSIQSRYDEYLQATEGRNASYGKIAHIDSLRGKDLDEFEKELDEFEANKYENNLKNYEKANSEWKELQSKMEKDYDEFGTTNWKDEKRLNELSKERDIAQSQISPKDVKKSNEQKTLEQQYADDLHNGKTNGTYKQWLDKKNGKTDFTREELNNLERIGEKKVEISDDYKVKSGNPIESMANDRVKEKQNSLQNTKSMLDYMEKNKIDKLPDGTTKDELEFKNWERQNYIDTANGNFENLKKNTMSEAEKEKYMKDNNLTTFTSRDEYNYLKNKEKATNEAINNKLREKTSKKDKFEEDLPKHVPIKEQGTSNRKEVSENIQAHILEYYGPDYTGDDSISASEAFVRQMDAMGEPNMWRAGQRIAEGGSYLIYNQDMADFLDELKINPKGKKFSEDKSFDMYTSLIGRESAKLYDRIKRNSYNKYMKEHPLSRMTFEEFKKEK